MDWLWVGVGGFLGANARYWLSSFIAGLVSNPVLPYGTITVNILGCFVIGFLGEIGEYHHWFSQNLYLFLLVGFLGGFTTFSSFGFEAFHLLQEHQIVPAMIDVLLQVGLGLLGVVLGFGLARLILT